MHTVEEILVQKNYSKCPLKKRPVNYQFDNQKLETKQCSDQPENLSLKKDIISLKKEQPEYQTPSSQEEMINVSDCCEDEGVDVDNTDDDYLDEEDEEMIDCVDIEENHEESSNTTQAAALAAAAAVAAVVVPTPTYPKYGIQPWSFHMSPYTAEFYRTINNPHLTQHISPLRSDLLSPSSPSDSMGSLSPPPHYLHGRASSVSPPMRSEVIHRPIGVRQLPQSPQHQTTHHHHRFMPYALPAYHQTAAYPLGFPQHAPISPAYSESSYYSMRSMTPESICSSVPEDLSLKHASVLKAQKTLPHSCEISLDKSNDDCNESTTNSTTSVPSSPSAKKDKNSPPRYQCPDCQKSYSTFSGLTKHQQFHCPAAEGNQIKKSFSCKDCDKTYVSLGALKMHIRTHTLPCKCNICGKAFSRPWLLQGHIRTHTGEKPFSCQHCHRAFADRSNLRAHLQTHSDIKKYSCTNCSKTFSRMSLLTKHSEGGCPGGNSSCVNSNASDVNASYAAYVEH